MTHLRQSLYRAICSHPDEDMPRWAFADLLEETGNARDQLRAQFIRTQLAVATQPLYSAEWVRARRLYPDIATGWLLADTLPKPLPSGFSWRYFEFRRGFPWAVGVDSLQPLRDSGLAIFDLAPIQALQLHQPLDGHLGLLAEWPGLERLHGLGVAGGWYCPRTVAQLITAPGACHIHELRIHEDGFSPSGLQTLAESAFFGQLTRLEMYHSRYPGTVIVEALATAEKPGAMRHLAMAFCHLTGADVARLVQLPWLQTIEHLELTDQPLGPSGVRSIATQGHLTQLRILNLSNTRPGPRGVRALTQSDHLRNLRMLDLSHNSLGPEAIKALAAAEQWDNLSVLNLANNPLDDTGVIALARSALLRGLLELDLRNVTVHDQGAIALAESPFLDNLLLLDLRGCDQHTWSDKARTALVERFGSRVWL
ncbi:MAG: TIGR02996 domain-containing protein [Gemmataceae bacterium]|nr:TIGR02996 domain-containing protein [Gemmata sp.]MDW8198420.1 TIGR02996 domain-containing protein [Gemmataceae bacterium]